MRKYLRVSAVSDLHGHLSHSIPECDVLLINGDTVPLFSSAEDHHPVQETDWMVTKFARWLRRQIRGSKAKFVFINPGNHDIFFLYSDQVQRVSRVMRDIQADMGCCIRLTHPNYANYAPMHYVDGVRFSFFAYTPTIQNRNWAFSQRRTGQGTFASVSHIHEDTDVLVTHGPPYGILDACGPRGGGHVGCAPLLHRMMEVSPAFVITGHVHEARGLHQNALDLWGNTIKCINACICDRDYRPAGSRVQTFLVATERFRHYQAEESPAG